MEIDLECDQEGDPSSISPFTQSTARKMSWTVLTVIMNRMIEDHFSVRQCRMM